MAGPNTQTSRLPENQEGNERNRMNVITSLATLALALSISTQVANAQNSTQVAMNAQAPAPTTSVQGVGVGQIASNGESFDEFLKKHGNKAIDEAEKMVDSGKWKDRDFDNFVKYRKEYMVQANLSKQNEGKALDQAAIKETSDWWKEIQPTLAKLPQDKVITFLKQDKEGYQKLLQFIVDNDIPPPGYAKQLLFLLKSA